jgi:hypothetical protein
MEKHLNTSTSFHLRLEESFLTSIRLLVIGNLKEAKAALVIAESSCAKSDDKLRDVNSYK